MTHQKPFTAAAAHLAPIYFDAAATTDKAIDAIGEAARHGASIIAFPESFVPGFPVWAAGLAPIESHDHFRQFVAASISATGSEIQRIRATAERHSIVVSLGFSERNPASVGGLWNSNLLIGDRGNVLVHHRKLVPTFYEKLVWDAGDGDGLRVAETAIGRIGALICGENTNPLARFSLMAQSEDIHISTWPPAWPTRPPTDIGNFDNRLANRLRAAAHAFEAKCFGIVVAGCLDRPGIDAIAGSDAKLRALLEATPKASSFFVDPTGASFGDACEGDDEGLCYAKIDLAHRVEPKRFHDVVAGYNRFDVFDLSVQRRRFAPVRFSDVLPEPAAADEILIDPTMVASHESV